MGILLCVPDDSQHPNNNMYTDGVIYGRFEGPKSQSRAAIFNLVTTQLLERTN